MTEGKGGEETKVEGTWALAAGPFERKQIPREGEELGKRATRSPTLKE